MDNLIHTDIGTPIFFVYHFVLGWRHISHGGSISNHIDMEKMYMYIVKNMQT